MNLSERDFSTQIIDLAHLYGWRVAHFRPAMTAHGWRTPVAADGAGFPDLVLVKPDRVVIYAELKSQSGKLTSEQEAWGQAIVKANFTSWRVWRPAQFEEIRKELAEV